jgi:hypothetical protein
LRFVALLAIGTPAALDGRTGGSLAAEIALAKAVVPQLEPGMVSLTQSLARLWI